MPHVAEPPGPGLTCMPGLGLDDAAWAPTLRALPGRTHAVVRMPGFGARPRRGERVDPVSLGHRLAEAHLEGRTGVVLAGHSASCQVVVEAALAAPEAVVGTVLVGPTTDPRAASWPALAGRWLRTAVHERPSQAPTLARSYTRTGLGHMRRTMAAARVHDVLAPLGGMACPVLVVRGPGDRIAPAGWASQVAAAGPRGSRAVTMPVGAHMVPLTHGPVLADLLRAFLDEVAPTA